MTSSIFRDILRTMVRASVLVASLFEVLLAFGLLQLRFRGRVPDRERAQWMHRSCAKIVARIGCEVHLDGPIPTNGLVVSNHLSYLDILFYGSQMPCIFVSKSDVRSWPFFGILAACGGTIFVDRDRRSSIRTPAERIRAVLEQQIPVVLFPEGTSTDGQQVLPFHSAFLEPAISAGAILSPAALRYTLDGGVEAELCYYGDIAFAPHLLGVLRRTGVCAEIHFAHTATVHGDRKEAARSLHQQVAALRSHEDRRVETAGTFV